LEGNITGPKLGKFVGVIVIGFCVGKVDVGKLLGLSVDVDVVGEIVCIFDGELIGELVGTVVGEVVGHDVGSRSLDNRIFTELSPQSKA